MSDDTGQKSAYELAMERLRKQDEEAGIGRQVVTAAQKAEIAEIRNFYEAQLAELEILREGRLRSMFDPSERALLEDAYRRDRERLTSERDAKVEQAQERRHPLRSIQPTRWNVGQTTQVDPRPVWPRTLKSHLDSVSGCPRLCLLLRVAQA